MLKLVDISKDYFIDKMPFRALNHINLDFEKNGFISILGPSGCGKTTLLNIIGGLDHYTEGDLIIDGKSTKEYKDKDWDNYRNKKIGFVFQSYNLINHLTILENVELPLRLAGVDKKTRSKAAKEALNEVGLHDIYNKKPNQLSGGQQQRVAIARSLINNPSVILADEPTGALDSKTSIQVIDILKEISKKKLVIMVTHNAEIAKNYSTRIIQLKDGNIESDSVINNDNQNVDNNINVNKKKTSMSFVSALKMSLRNLLTKKGRTIATSIASSFGIIGVALVLAISNGFTQYINKVESQAVSTLPINVASVIQYAEKRDESELNPSYPDDNLLRPEISQYTGNYSYKSSNISSKFINYLEYLKNDKKLISKYFNIYNSNYSFNLVTKFNDTLKIVDNSYGSNSMTDAIMSSYIGLPSYPFHAFYGDNKYITSTYDCIYGNYPKEDNFYEIALVVDKKNQIPFSTLKTLGFFADYSSDQQEEANKNPISFDDVLNKEYKIILNDDLYDEKIDESNNKTYYLQNDLNDVFNDSSKSITLKVTGILRPKKDASVISMNPGLCYNSDLIEYVNSKNEISKITTSISSNLSIKDESTLNNFKEELLNIISSNNFGSENVKLILALFNSYLNFHSLYSSKNVSSTSFYYELAKIGCDEGVNSKNIEYFSDDLDSKINSIFDLFNTNKEEFYSSLLNIFTYYSSYSKIRSVVIFANGLEEKTKILSALDSFNNINSSEKEEYHAIKESEKIYYIDIVSDFTSSLSIIINTISIVLIIFASISLIVSSVMTSIITYVSVVERTKEIGILRALGSRKKDVGRLFKAECFIIGLLSGIFGIVVTYLVSLPINLIVNNMFPTYGLTSIASLNYIHAIILILVAIVLSYFSGLVPARIAAKKDPVTALRTE